MYSSTISSTSALDEGGWSTSTARALYKQERPGTRYKEGWVGTRACLDGCGKSRPAQGFYPRTVQPVASQSTELSRLEVSLAGKNVECSEGK
jgi:hypothetical protein